jgi:hypothetical protein
LETGGFKNWDKYQNKYMKAPDSIQNYHIFEVNTSNPNRLKCQEAKGYPVINDDTVVRKQFRDQEWGSLEDELEDVPPIGMKDIKWITLYDEWRPLVPLDLRADYEYFHNDPGPVRREKNKINRGEAAATRQQRSITHDNKQKPNSQKGSPADKVAKKVAKKKSATKATVAKTTVAKAKPKRKDRDNDRKPPAKKRGPFNIQFGKL